MGSGFRQETRTCRSNPVRIAKNGEIPTPEPFTATTAKFEFWFSLYKKAAIPQESLQAFSLEIPGFTITLPFAGA
jgi:hypothetical protein